MTTPREPRHLTRREEHDVREMQNEAPNAEPQDVDGTIVWYEWVKEGGQQYHLAYWFDINTNQYKAAVMEGLISSTVDYPRLISPDGIIDIRSLGHKACSQALEARSRAIEALELKSTNNLEESMSTNDQRRMRIMTLGFSTAGKTFYLGSLGKLKSNPGAKGFSLQAKDYIKLNEIAKLYKIVSGDKEGSISTTVDLRPHFMVLKQGMNPVLDIEITDIEGQALEEGRNIDIAEKIAKQIGNYDGLILIAEAPGTSEECQKRKDELAQMLNFAGEVLKRNRSIPLTLVLTKIDKLPDAKEVISQLKEELNTFESNLKKRYKNFGEIKRWRQSNKGTVVNKYVQKIIHKEEIYELYDTFFNFLRPTSIDIPNKVFPCTSLGLNVLNEDADLTLESYEKQQVYEPYGSAASFLWTIYAALLSQPRESLENLVEGMSIDSLKDNLLEEIRELHTSGQAYFSPESEEPQNDIFHLRNIANLRTHQIET